MTLQVQASEASTRLPQLLDAVERGETVIITRHGRRIARIVPETERRQQEVDEAIAAYLELALPETLPLATLDAALIRAARAEAVPLIGDGGG